MEAFCSHSGCAFSAKYLVVAEHEKSCPRRRLPCPIRQGGELASVVGDMAPACDWTGVAEDLRAHLAAHDFSKRVPVALGFSPAVLAGYEAQPSTMYNTEPLLVAVDRLDYPVVALYWTQGGQFCIAVVALTDPGPRSCQICIVGTHGNVVWDVPVFPAAAIPSSLAMAGPGVVRLVPAVWKALTGPNEDLQIRWRSFRLTGVPPLQ